MKRETLLDILATLQGEALERAYVLLRTKVIAQRKAARLRQHDNSACWLLIITNRPPGSRLTAVHARVSDSVRELTSWKRPSDRVAKTCRLDQWPSPDVLRGVVSDIFARVNPNWRGVPQWISHNDGVEFSMKGS